MKIGVFTLKDYNKSKDLPRFKRAAQKHNLDIEFYNPADIYISIKDNEISVCLKDGTPIDIYGAVNWIPYAKYDEISYALNSMGIPYINSIQAVRNCRNKVLTNILLSNYYFNQPHSVYYPHIVMKSQIDPKLDYPFVSKKKNGSRGYGSHKLDDYDGFNGLLNEKYSKDSLYFQEYINNMGYDYRIMAVGDKVVGGIKKYYQKGEWRTHIAHGGRVEHYEVPDDLQKISIDILKALNLHFAGIDIMTDVEGRHYILEVNSVPGMSILNNLTGINFADEILLYLKMLIQRNVN